MNPSGSDSKNDESVENFSLKNLQITQTPYIDNNNLHGLTNNSLNEIIRLDDEPRFRSVVANNHSHVNDNNNNNLMNETVMRSSIRDGPTMVSSHVPTNFETVSLGFDHLIANKDHSNKSLDFLPSTLNVELHTKQLDFNNNSLLLNQNQVQGQQGQQKVINNPSPSLIGILNALSKVPSGRINDDLKNTNKNKSSDLVYDGSCSFESCPDNKKNFNFFLREVAVALENLKIHTNHHTFHQNDQQSFFFDFKLVINNNTNGNDIDNSNSCYFEGLLNENNDSISFKINVHERNDGKIIIELWRGEGEGFLFNDFLVHFHHFIHKHQTLSIQPTEQNIFIKSTQDNDNNIKPSRLTRKFSLNPNATLEDNVRTINCLFMCSSGSVLLSQRDGFHKLSLIFDDAFDSYDKQSDMMLNENSNSSIIMKALVHYEEQLIANKSTNPSLASILLIGLSHRDKFIRHSACLFLNHISAHSVIHKFLKSSSLLTQIINIIQEGQSIDLFNRVQYGTSTSSSNSSIDLSFSHDVIILIQALSRLSCTSTAFLNQNNTLAHAHLMLQNVERNSQQFSLPSQEIITKYVSNLIARLSLN